MCLYAILTYESIYILFLLMDTFEAFYFFFFLFLSFLYIVLFDSHLYC